MFTRFSGQIRSISTLIGKADISHQLLRTPRRDCSFGGSHLLSVHRRCLPSAQSHFVVFAHQTRSMHIAVIGAGAAGICAAKNVLAAGCSVTVFEQTDQLGGTWVYTDQIGHDEYGIEVHSSMYKGLCTNLPKEIMGYPDFPFPEQTKSYLPAHEVLDFLQLYARRFDVVSHIRFRHYVLRIRPLSVGQRWEVIVRDLPGDRVETLEFDAVMVCNGHYSAPAIPEYPGSDSYGGQHIHSHDFRCADPFKGETVLIIGAGKSGMDLAYDIARKAERVTLSHHRPEQPQTKFPTNVDLRPDVRCLTQSGAVFVDDSEQTYSTIFYCTGYKYSFPFLSIDCGLTVDDNFVQPLYKHCININRPTMALIGLPNHVCAAQTFDLQSRFSLAFWTGHKELPSRDEMLAVTDREMAERWSRGIKKRQAHTMGPDQKRYYDSLAEAADIENLQPVMAKLHSESSRRILLDQVNFRHERFRVVDSETFEQIQDDEDEFSRKPH